MKGGDEKWIGNPKAKRKTSKAAGGEGATMEIISLQKTTRQCIQKHGVTQHAPAEDIHVAGVARGSGHERAGSMDEGPNLQDVAGECGALWNDLALRKSSRWRVGRGTTCKGVQATGKVRARKGSKAK